MSPRLTTATSILQTHLHQSSTQFVMSWETFRYQGPQLASCTLPPLWVISMNALCMSYNGKINWTLNVPPISVVSDISWPLMQGCLQNSRHSSHRRSAHGSTREEYPVNPVVSVSLLNAVTPPCTWANLFSAVFRCELLDFMFSIAASKLRWLAFRLGGETWY